MEQANINKLKLFMNYNDISVKTLAIILNMSEQTLRNRIKGKVDFTTQDIELFLRTYGLKDTERIFFKRY